jgi:5-deoxy-glucuronate isomerase
MNHMLRPQLKRGYTETVSPPACGIRYITFGVVELGNGERHSGATDSQELVGVVLAGKCAVKGQGFDWGVVGQRRSVFDGKATGFYLPAGTSYTLTAVGPCTIALCRAPSDAQSKPVLVQPDDVRVKVVGRHNWKRYVHDIVDLRVPAQRLVVGETFNPPGNWSSCPPHRHEKENLPEEVAMEEVYYFKVWPPQGFGFQRIYTDDSSTDVAYVIHDNDTVAIPRGYHPVAAAPGYRLYYLWMLAGSSRVLQPRDDPQHAWLKNCEPILDESGK